MDYYMHLIPGRIRIRTHVFKAIEGSGTPVGQKIHSIKGVTSVNVNQIIGTVLICYDRSRITSQNIIQELTKKGLFPAGDSESPKGIPRVPFEPAINSNQFSNG